MREVQLPAVLGSGWELINVGLLHSLNVYCLCLVLCLGVLVLRARKGISSLCSNHTQKEIFKNIFWWDIMRKVVLNSPIAQLKVLDLGFGSSSAGHQSVHARARTPHCVPLRAQNPSRKSQITAVSQSLPLVIWNVWGNLISCGSLSQMRNGNWFKKKKKGNSRGCARCAKDAASISTAHCSALLPWAGTWVLVARGGDGLAVLLGSLIWQESLTVLELEAGIHSKGEESSSFHCVKESGGRKEEHRLKNCLNHSSGIS